MNTLRPSAERGHTQLDWLDSRHSFSFDQYFDTKYMGFGPLRVINEDIVAPGGGFGMHPHRNMEIITYVIEGQLKHEDSLGNGSIISPGEIQKMSAGSGIWHSEFNASDEQPVHLLQIWIVPDKTNIQPYYEQKQFERKAGIWQLLASNDGKGLVQVHQRVKLYNYFSTDSDQQTTFNSGGAADFWMQVVRGACSVAGQELKNGDGIAIQDGSELQLDVKGESELLLFEFAKT